MIDNEPYLFDPQSGWTGWKKDGQWLITKDRVWFMDRHSVKWYPPSPELIERLESLCVAV